MTDIFPAEGESVSDIANRLQAKGFVPDQDFRVHFTWDMKPFIKATPETYEKWGEGVGEADAENTDADKSADADGGADGADESADGDKTDSGKSTTDDTGKGRQASKRR